MTHAILEEQSNVENPHMRLDEDGEASAKPRRLQKTTVNLWEKCAFWLGVLISAGAAQAGSSYSWKSGLDGVWSDQAKWSPNTGYPQRDDSALFDLGTYTVSDDDDVVALDACINTGTISAPANPIIDMNGHSFSLVQSNAFAFTISGESVNTMSLDPLPSSVSFLNGTFNISSFYLAYAGTDQAGGFTVGANAVLNGHVSYWVNGARIFVKDGGLWNNDTWYGVDMGYDMHCGFGFLCVMGDRSRVEMNNGSIQVRGDHNGVYVLDGGVISSVWNMYVGGDSLTSPTGRSYASDDTFLEIRNGTIAMQQVFKVGWPFDEKCSPRVTIVGSDSYLEVNGLATIFNGLGTKLEFDCSDGAFTNAEGVIHAPIKFNSLELVDRDPAYADYGATKLVVNGLAHIKADGDSEIPLISLDIACEEALKTLAESGVFPDYDARHFETAPQLFVSDDNRQLVLRVPRKRQGAILFSASAEVLTQDSVRFTVMTENYGGGADSATYKLQYSRDEYFETYKEEVLWDAVSDPLPWTKSKEVSGFVGQHARYFARVILQNSEGNASTNLVTLTTGGVPETYTWINPEGGNWNDVTNWSSSDQTFVDDPTPPHSEDKIASYISGTYTIVLQEDVSVQEIGSVQTMDASKKKQVTFELGGHVLTAEGGGTSVLYIDGAAEIVAGKVVEYTSADNTLPNASVTFRNGTVHFSDAARFMLAGPNNCYNAGLVLDNCTFDGNAEYWDNASRVWVINGAKWTAANGIMMDNYAAALQWPFVKVQGVGSEFKSAWMFVKGPNAGLIVADGAKATIDGWLYTGFSPDAAIGCCASTNTYIHIDNATIETKGVDLGWTAATNLGPRLVVSGAQALLQENGFGFKLYDKLGTRLCFDIPEDGFVDPDGVLRAPLQINGTLTFVARAAGLENWGETRFELSLGAWKDKHRGSRIPLVELGTANRSALETLASYPIFVKGRKTRSVCFSVSDDGRVLFLEAPNRGLSIVIR